MDHSVRFLSRFDGLGRVGLRGFSSVASGPLGQLDSDQSVSFCRLKLNMQVRFGWVGSLVNLTLLDWDATWLSPTCWLEWTTVPCWMFMGVDRNAC